LADTNLKKAVTMRSKSDKGFTLIELMIVVVIIGILAALAIPRFMSSATKAKQSEAKEVLKQVYTMQRAYFVEHETYCLNGVVADAGNPSAFSILAVEIMPPARYSYTMTVPNPQQFTCVAQANLDDDATIDTWSIDQTGTLVNVIDDSML
jgi:prepilin-type N-terminal cleavage/methylation domain-containing protein